MSGTYEYVLGMDIGTTNQKALILRSDGQVIAEEEMQNTFLKPGPKMQEQDACAWWDTAVKIFRSLTHKAGEEVIRQLRGICISSHTVSLLAVDERGIPLRPAMTYQDGRSHEELKEILEQIGTERFIRIVGGQPSIAFLPNKLSWFRRNEPELYRKTAWFLQASSYINYKLTGVMVSDIDQAFRTQCMDMETMNWSEEIGHVIGVDLHKKMPPICQVDEIIGYVTEEAAALTGLAAGIPVLAGCSDAMASMYATGISSMDEAGESSGTTSLVFVGCDRKSAPDVPVVTRPCSIEGMPWLFDAPIQASGASLKWYIDTFAAEEKAYAEEHGLNLYNYLNDLAEQAKPGSQGLFYYPYLMGERAPLWNDYACGMWIGMRMDTTRCDLIRSIFEGTAFALRHVMETVKASGARPKILRVCGGGAKSRTWNKIKASMLHMPVYVLDGESGNVPVGDALIAGHKLGVFPDLRKATEATVKVREIIPPDPVWEEIYDRMYPYYIEMYKCLDPQLQSLQKTLTK